MVEYEDIVDSIRLDEVLNDLGVNIVQIAKGEHWASCPLPSHPGADAKPSFSINEDSLAWNCFVCGGGRLPKLVWEIENLDTWDEAVLWLLPYSDGDVETDDGHLKQLERYFSERTGRPPQRERTPEFPFYLDSILERWEPCPLEFLEKWHITRSETVEHHRLKYDHEHTRFFSKGEYTGPAIIIPHFFGGKLVGYQERWLADDRPKRIAKYTNSDDFPRKDTLYGWDDALEDVGPETPVIVVESAMTRARLWELGYVSVATFGATVSDRQLRLLRSLPSVVLATDNDPDFFDAAGKLRRGAGAVNLEKTADALTDYTQVEILPSVAKEKGDLADIEEDEVHDLYRRRKAVFSPLTAGKGRKRSY